METILNNRYIYNPSESNILGQGQFGTVSRGVDTQTNTPIAIKQLVKEEFEDEYLSLALKKEIEILRLIKCPYSTQLIDTFSTDDDIFVIMELCDSDLERELNKHRQGFTLDEVRKIMIQLNQVFYIMYTNKIMHRDLKLQNIFIKYTNPPNNTEFDVKLGDYGLSTITQDNIAFSSVGTPLTMAPEILNGNSYSNKADLWSVGVIAYRLHFKKYPFNGRNLEMLKVDIKRKITIPTGDELFNDLLKRLLTYNEDHRISWEDYLKHPFFGNAILLLTPSINDDDPSLWQSVVTVGNNVNNKQTEIVKESLFHHFGDINYACNVAKNTKTNETCITKTYGTSFANAHKTQLDNEINLFKTINSLHIPCIMFKELQKEKCSVTLIFENLTDYVVLNDYIKAKQLSEQMTYDIINSLIKDIFIPLNNNGIILPLITLDSIAINTKTGKALLFECGLHKWLYSLETINEYYIYNNTEPPSIQNEKTNVLNFIITILKARYGQHNINAYTLYKDNPLQGLECTDDFKSFVNCALNRDMDKRATWKILVDMPYMKEPFKLIPMNKSLFELHTLECIYKAYQTKQNVFEKFLSSQVYKELESQYAKITALFLLYNIANLYYMIQLFKDMIQHKESMDYIITIFNINENNPSTMKTYSESLNFKLIPNAQRWCSENVMQRIKELPLCYEDIRKKIFELFVKQSKLAHKRYFRMKLNELLNEIFECLSTNDLWNYIDSLSKGINSHKEGKAVGYLYLKYVLEFVFGIYESIFNEQKVIKYGFHEVNDMFMYGKGKEFICVNMNEPDLKKCYEVCTVFTCFLKREILKFKESVDVNKLFENKGRLGRFHEMVVQAHMTCFGMLKSNL